MKPNTNTVNYLRSLDIKPVILNEAQKTKIKKAAKLSALYSFMGLSVLSACITGGVVVTLKVQDFFKNNELVFASPVEMRVWTNKVVSIVPIEKPKTTIVDTLRVRVIENAKDKTLAQKIYDTFTAKGLDGQKAVAVSMAESGMNCNAVGVNVGSADLGLFQLNSKFQLPKGNLKDFGDCDKNMEFAANLVAEQGWRVFSSVNSGAYLKFMDSGLSYASE
jgi:hypothetical protein